MSDNAGELSVEISGKDVNLTSLLNRIEQQLQKAEQTGQRTGRAIGDGVGSGAQRGASGALAMQQAVARLEVAQGNAAGAADRLRNALAQQDTATVQTINAQRQLIAVENQLQQSQSGAAATIEAFKNGLVGFAAPAAIASTAIGAIKSGIQSFADAFDFKAKLDQSTASIKVQLNGVRDSGEVFAGAARFAAQYKLTQEETTTAIQSSIPVIRNSKASIEDILGVFARLRVLKPEKSFDDAARALGELQAGQVQSIVSQFNLSRTAANQMKQEIEGGADAVQVLSKYLTDSGTTMDSLAIQTQGVVGKMRELAQTQEELKLAQADFAQGPGLAILETRLNVTRGLTRLLSGDFEAGRQSIAQFANEGSFGFQLFNQIMGGSLERIAFFQNAQNAANATIRQGSALTIQATAAYDAATAGIRQQAQAEAQATAALQEMNAQIADSAAKSAADSATKEAQVAQTQLLQFQTQQAAQAFLALNPNISQSGIAAAQASGQISAAVAQYINMTLAAQNARNELARLQAQAGVIAAAKVPANQFLPIGRTDLASSAEGQANVARLKTLQQQEKDLADARRQQIIQTGSAAQVQALYNKELQDATRIYGANSAQAIRAKTTLDQFTESQKKSAGAGGGRTKLSDQQKLNNSLLADQQKFNDQYEDADLKHAQDVLKIQQDFQQKMRDAQRTFDQDSLEGRASFYDNLGNIESDKIRKMASQQYEAAAQEAQQIAAEKGADVADKYMSAQEQVISARAKRLAEIEKAQKDKDNGKAEYLQGVDEAYRKAEDAKLARIKEGEGSLTDERDKQLQDENQKYEEAQGKIADAADRAADRKIAAAERAGKKIDEEQLKADKLAKTYDKIAPAAQGGAAAVPSVGNAPAPTPPDSSAGAAAPIEPGKILEKLDELRAAVVAATDKGATKVADAIKSSGRNGGSAG